MIIKAYSYIRFSDPSQAKGDSYARQHRDTVAYCNANGLELVSDETYTFFDEGIPAFKGPQFDDGTELSQFLKYVDDGSIAPGSVLIVESLDRISREHIVDALPRFMDLLKRDIVIHTLQNNKTYYKKFDQFDLFQSIMEMSRAHSESALKSDRVGKAWKAKQENARSGTPLGKTKPAWLDLVYDNGFDKKPTGFTPNDKVDVVKRIFELTLDGHGRNVVARMLNAEGIPAFRTTEGWGASTINQILTNEAVLGIYQPYTKGDDGKRVKRGEPFMFYPPIIDRDTFDSARAATTGRAVAKARKQTPEFQIWQGIAKCQLCGSPLHTYGNGRKPKEGQPAPRWMRCYNAKKGQCTAGSIAVVSLEPVFKEILAKLNVLALVQSSASAINAKLEVVTGKLIAERTKLKKFKDDYTERPSDTVRDVLYATEDRIAGLVKEEQKYLADLAADQIVDKADFFARLDLTSYAGRSRSNSILKRLQVEVGINTDQLRFHIRKAGASVFDIALRESRMLAYPANYEFSSVIQRQDGTFTPMLSDQEDNEDAPYESEGHDSREY